MNERIGQNNEGEHHAEGIVIHRTCAVVLVHVGDAVYIPLILNTQRKDWELPGGGREPDVVGQQQAQEAWKSHKQLYPDEFSDPEEIPYEVIQEGANRVVQQLKERDAYWQEEEMMRELREELHFTAKPDSIKPLTPYEQQFIVNKSGSGRKLRILSSSFIARYSLRELPEFVPTEEHHEVMWLRWQNWDDLKNQRTAFIQLMDGCNVSQLRIQREEGEMPIYSFQEKRNDLVQPEAVIHLSQISAATLKEYIGQSFNAPTG